MTRILTRFKSFLQTISDNLTDVHDPSGVHWHRAVNGTLAAGVVALLLMLNPGIVQPLAVISALIFSHTNKGSQLFQQRRSQWLALGLTLIGVILLTLIHDLVLAKAIVIILSSFLVQYATKFGPEYGFTFVLILCLTATRNQDVVEGIPLMFANIGIGFSLAYSGSTIVCVNPEYGVYDR